ncbi:MAG: ribonuclease HII [Alphaproteobacteria bacterium]|nr:ribonuclease HII [Alphaproteobacteria bacterium]
MTDFSIEDQFEGNVCGLDEVGRGPLAGPVVAACVVIPKDKRDLDFVTDIKDSKKLSLSKRESLFSKITEHFPYAIAEIQPNEIDELNILQASLKAMADAFIQMECPIDRALVDGNKAPALNCPITCVVKGDSKSKTIAAASIIAKVHRDRIMHKISEDYPFYKWIKNSGYPTQEHRDAILKHGITPHHRKTFAPVYAYLKTIESHQ